MRHGVFAFALAWSMATSVTDQSPTKPDFSGTWRLDPAASVLTPPPGVSGDATAFPVSPTLLKPIVVAQNARTLALTQTPGDEAFTFTYQLDGSPSKLAWPSGAAETVEATAIAKWDNDTLRIATHIPINGAVYDNTETWSLARGRLTIERTTSRGKEVRVYQQTRHNDRTP